MPRVTVAELLTDAKTIFAGIAAEADRLAADEETQSYNRKPVPAAVTRGWQQTAQQAAAKLNSAAPQMRPQQLELLHGTSLMLSEISMAQTPAVVAERYHARRADIESGLIRLGE